MFIFPILLLVIYCEEVIKDKQLSIKKDIFIGLFTKKKNKKQLIGGTAYISSINMMKYLRSNICPP